MDAPRNKSGMEGFIKLLTPKNEGVSKGEK